ncbi:MAG: hypothetical protein QOD99_2389 [Chthoniobacter sp.]|nr:hypothetical protein [Chthoniobacter sp.]
MAPAQHAQIAKAIGIAANLNRPANHLWSSFASSDLRPRHLGLLVSHCRGNRAVREAHLPQPVLTGWIRHHLGFSGDAVPQHPERAVSLHAAILTRGTSQILG